MMSSFTNFADDCDSTTPGKLQNEMDTSMPGCGSSAVDEADSDCDLKATVLFEFDSSRDSMISETFQNRQKRPPPDENSGSHASKKLREVGNPLVSPYVEHRAFENRTENDELLTPATNTKTYVDKFGSVFHLFIPSEQFVYDGDNLFSCKLCIEQKLDGIYCRTSPSSQISHVTTKHPGWHLRRPDAEAFKKSLGEGADDGDNNEDEEEVAEAPDFTIVIKLLEKYRRDGEKIDPYVIYFLKTVNECNGNEADFDKLMRQKVVSTSIEINKEEEPELAHLFSNAEFWMKDEHAEHIIYSLNALIRSKVLLFASEEKEGRKSPSTFTLNCKKKPLLEELKHFLAYMWRNKSGILMKRMSKIQSFTKRNDLLIPSILKTYFFQVANHIDERTEVEEYCMVRSMTLSQGGLQFRDCDSAASIVARVLKLLRAGLLTYLALTKRMDYNQKLNYAIRAQDAYLPSALAVIIRCQRDMNEKKHHVCKAYVDEDGSIFFGNNKYLAEQWRQVIPSIVKRSEEIFQKIFRGDLWKRFFDFQVALKVKRVRENRIEFWISHDENQLTCRDLQLEVLSNTEMFQIICEITTIIKLAFDVLGCGPGRMEEVNQMLLNHLVFELGTCSYWLLVRKLPTATIPDNQKERKVEHTLPMEITRIYLLFHEIISRLDEYKDNCWVIPRIGSNPFKVGMILEEIFQLDDTPMLPEIRQVFASFQNILFPDANSLVLICSKEAAEAMGHSLETHCARYHTNIPGARLKQIRQYHTALGGEPLVYDDSKIGNKDFLQALQFILKQKAGFKSEQQKQMVSLAANEKIHVHVGIPCGGGKSMAYTLLVAAAKIRFKKIRLNIVVSPYNFLNEYQAVAAMKLLKGLNARIEVVDSAAPQMIQRAAAIIKDGEADILFMSVTSFADLIRTESKCLRREFIHRIFIDEVHTLLSETFRKQYEEMRKLGSFGVPVMTLSGTLHRKLIRPLYRYLGLGSETINAITSNNLIGKIPRGFHFDCRKVDNPVNTACSIVHELLRKNPNDAIHVICATKNFARSVNANIMQSFKTMQIDAESAIEVKRQAASDWLESSLQVLITTTCGLVGNENPQCRHVLVIGHIYSMDNIIQAFNRLRPGQRKSTGSFRVILPHSQDSHDEKLDLNKWTAILDKKILTEAEKKYYDRTCSMKSLTEWACNQQECAVVLANASYGVKVEERCGACNCCRKDPVLLQTSKALNDQSKLKQTFDKARKVLMTTLNQCVICGSSSCDGEKCSKGCFICGLKHDRDKCPLYGKGGVKAIFERVRQTCSVVGCYACLKVHFEPCVTIDKRLQPCLHQKRVRRIIHHAFATKIAKNRHEVELCYDLFLGKILSNEDEYYALLASYVDFKPNGTLKF